MSRIYWVFRRGFPHSASFGALRTMERFYWPKNEGMDPDSSPYATHYCIMMGVYRDNGKENGNYYIILGHISPYITHYSSFHVLFHFFSANQWPV